MTASPATCDPSTTLRLVTSLMTDHDCAAIPVTESGRLIGIITDRDIAIRGVALHENAASVETRECMSTPVIAIGGDEPIERAIPLMTENVIHHLPVINDKGMVVGILAQSDLGRRMTNRDFGQLARSTSIRMKYAYRRTESITRREH